MSTVLVWRSETGMPAPVGSLRNFHGRKHSYATYEDARAMRDHLLAYRSGALRVYRCPGCGDFHLTSKPLLRK